MISRCILACFLVIVVNGVRSETMGVHDRTLVVSFPLRGVCISPNTPGSKVPSHGTSAFGEEYAIDFVVIDDDGNSKKPYRKSFFAYLFNGLQLNDFYGWARTVYSPVDGVVVEIENDIDERNPVNIFNDYKNTMKVTRDYIERGASPKIITGNYVLLQIDEKTYVLLAHLKKGSVKVKIGQKVRADEAIGQLGHSGNSTMPHLHMQFMDSPDFKTARGIPFVFKTYELKHGNEWTRVHDAVPRAHDVVGYAR